MLCSLVSIFAFLLLSIAAFGLGRPLLRYLGVGHATDRLATTVFSLGVGLTVAGCVLLGLALAGVFFVPLIVLLTMLGCCWGLVEVGNLCLRLSENAGEVSRKEPADESPGRPWARPPRWLLFCVTAASVAVCAASLSGALTPPTADAAFEGRLDLAQRLLVEHRTVDLPAGSPCTTPRVIDMWYGWALALDGGVCAQLVHWGLGLLLMLATVVLATPLLGRAWAWVAGGLVVLTPEVSRQMSLPTESVALAAFTTLALASWWQAVAHGGRWPWFVVAGLVAGSAMGIHYAALLVALPVGILWAWRAYRRTEQRRFLIHGGAVAALTAVGIGGVFSWPPTVVSKGVASVSIGDPSDYLGMVLLAAVPGVVLVRRLRGLSAVLFAAVAYISVMDALAWDPKLLFPAVPLLSAAAIWVWIELRRFPRAARRVAVASLAVMLTCGLAKAVVRPPETWRVALGLENREDYLSRCEPTYPAAVMANRLLRPGDRILSQERRLFYFDCPATYENADRFLAFERASLSADDAIKRLRGEGYTHLLLAEPIDAEGRTNSRLSLLADEMFTLTDYRRRAADGRVRRYQLVALRSASRPSRRPDDSNHVGNSAETSIRNSFGRQSAKGSNQPSARCSGEIFSVVSAG